jgi:hypothetical protein
MRVLYSVHFFHIHSLRDFLETLPKVAQNRVKHFARFYTFKKLVIKRGGKGWMPTLRLNWTIFIFDHSERTCFKVLHQSASNAKLAQKEEKCADFLNR